MGCDIQMKIPTKNPVHRICTNMNTLHPNTKKATVSSTSVSFIPRYTYISHWA